VADWTEAEIGALRRLIKKAEADPEFSQDDIQALRQIADAFKGLRAFGRFAKWVIFVLAAIAGAVTAWETVAAKVRQWLGS
jgi:sensor domain CHASE-containing protein